MIEEIGQKIRNLRISAELTQDELAQRAGLTDGFISQMERGLTSISIDSLKMILDALNVSLSDFFKEDKIEPIVFSEEDMVELDTDGLGKLYSLIPGATNREMEPALLKLAPEELSPVFSPFDGDVFGHVLKGSVELKYGNDVIRIKTGQNFYFTADREHYLSNPFKRQAEVLWITAPPNF